MTTRISQPLTKQALDRFVSEWYVALDQHRPFEELDPFLDTAAISFVFPEVTVTDRAGLREWYERVTRTFFDEVHTVRSVQGEQLDSGARLKVQVQWETRVWSPPEPSSRINTYLADQTWDVVTRPDGRPGIHRYVVDSFVPVGDTPPLT